MADELKDKNDGQDAGQGHEGKPDERSDRTKERIEDLLGKLKQSSDSLEAEKKSRQEAEFELGFERIIKKYPNASEFRENVKKLVASGMSVEDAAVVELHKSGKLVTPEAVKDKEINAALGGSADTKGTDKSAKKSSEMTQEERRAKLVEMEKEGEIRLNP